GQRHDIEYVCHAHFGVLPGGKQLWHIEERSGGHHHWRDHPYGHRRADHPGGYHRGVAGTAESGVLDNAGRVFCYFFTDYAWGGATDSEVVFPESGGRENSTLHLCAHGGFLCGVPGGNSRTGTHHRRLCGWPGTQ